MPLLSSPALNQHGSGPAWGTGINGVLAALPFLVLLLGVPCNLKAQGPGVALAELDRLYDQRLDIKPVQELAEKCQALLSKNPKDYELLWRLSRAYFHLGREAQNRDDKLTYYKKAVEVGRQAVETNNDRIEGHFWLGISIAAVGETTSIMKSLTSVGDVRKEMEKVVALDDHYEEGGGYRIQGRLVNKAEARKLLEECEKEKAVKGFKGE